MHFWLDELLEPIAGHPTHWDLLRARFAGFCGERGLPA
jgi:hypothetical protein